MIGSLLIGLVGISTRSCNGLLCPTIKKKKWHHLLTKSNVTKQPFSSSSSYYYYWVFLIRKNIPFSHVQTYLIKMWLPKIMYKWFKEEAFLNLTTHGKVPLWSSLKKKTCFSQIREREGLWTVIPKQLNLEYWKGMYMKVRRFFELCKLLFFFFLQRYLNNKKNNSSERGKKKIGFCKIIYLTNIFWGHTLLCAVI